MAKGSLTDLREAIRKEIRRNLSEGASLEAEKMITALLSWGTKNVEQISQVGQIVQKLDLEWDNQSVADVVASWYTLKLDAKKLEERIQRLAKLAGVTK